MNEEELFAALEVELAVMPCESAQHGFSPMHEGNGEWYITMTCPVCHESYDTLLACDRYKNYLPILAMMSGSSVLQCSMCKQSHLYSATIITTEKRMI